MSRRSVTQGAMASLGLGAFEPPGAERDAPVAAKDNLKVTKLETFLVKPRWLFLKVHTNAGIIGLGEPITEGRALTCAEAVKEIEPYLVGKDPRQVVRSIAAVPSSPALSAASTWPCGTSRARPSGCRSMSY
jgi:galactonate dehydratase